MHLYRRLLRRRLLGGGALAARRVLVALALLPGSVPYCGWKISCPEAGYPEFCQPIEQYNIDPNKALGQSIKITVALQFVFCEV